MKVNKTNVVVTTFDGEELCIDSDVQAGGDLTLVRYPFDAYPEYFYSRVTYYGQSFAVKLNSQVNDTYYLGMMGHQSQKGKVRYRAEDMTSFMHKFLILYKKFNL